MTGSEVLPCYNTTLGAVANPSNICSPLTVERVITGLHENKLVKGELIVCCYGLFHHPLFLKIVRNDEVHSDNNLFIDDDVRLAGRWTVSGLYTTSYLFSLNRLKCSCVLPPVRSLSVVA